MRRQVRMMLSVVLTGCMVLGMTACGEKSGGGTAAPEERNESVAAESSTAGAAAGQTGEVAEEG